MKTRLILIGLLISLGVSAQRILIVNGHLHPVVGQEITASLLEMVDGKITGIKNALSTTYIAKDWDTIIDATGQHVYPGFVAPNSTLGLREVDAIRATNDYNEVGEFNPHVRAQIAFNAESKVVETVKTNGVLLVQSTPRGGSVSGTSSVMFMGGWNWEDATVKPNDGIHVNWPSTAYGGGWWAEPAPKYKNEQYTKELNEIKQFFQLASTYANAKVIPFDQRLEAMKDCFLGTKRVYIHANDAQQIIDLLAFVQEFKLPYPVLVGGDDAYLLGQRFIDADIPVMIQRLHRLPEHDEDPVDLPYRLPAILAKMGVLFCLQNEGGMEAMNARNLPFLAGTAMAYGLTEEQALQAITINSCKILGIDQEFGSIEVGKSATIFVSKGPALDMKTNDVTTIVMNGKIQSPVNFQESLYLKYKAKYQSNTRD
jgi:hypothetical protein